MIRYPKTKVYDLMHKTTVGFLMAFTAVSTVYLGYRGVNWLFVTRPALNEHARKLAEEKLASEQTMRELELFKEQKIAENTLKLK